MKTHLPHLFAAILTLSPGAGNLLGSPDYFAPPGRGFVSSSPPRTGDWQQGILTGNGTQGALIVGQPFDDTIYLSHSALFLPNPNGTAYPNLAAQLEKFRELCLAGKYGSAGSLINATRSAVGFKDQRDPFIGACALRVTQPEATVTRYQRAVNFLTAEATVSVATDRGASQRSVFASRSDNVIVIRITGESRQTATLTLDALKPSNEREQKTIAEGVKSSEQGVKDGLLYFRTLFAHDNPYNPNCGYEVAGRVVSKGGTRTETANGITITGADEILVLVRIQPLPKDQGDTLFPSLKKTLEKLPSDYAGLLAPHAKIHGDLMGRVSLSLDAPAEDRAKSSDQLNKDSEKLDAPLAKIERAFDAGRYNIICSTGGDYPPNLQGLWSATWLAPWSGSFTTNGNLPTAVAFLLMGNTPELMRGYFRYHDDRWDGFRQNARDFFGMRGFSVPAQATLSPRQTDFNSGYPHCFWYGGAGWALQFYYDYYQYTGDRAFLAERAYPLMKEAAAFYEDFLTVTDADGRLVFVPSYSPENAPGGDKGHPATVVNATMDVSIARQLLGNAIAAARLLNRDPDLQKKWASIIAKLPAYQVADDGSFREWLWPGLPESNNHRHASHLYALYDEMPADIVDNPVLVKAVEHTIDERMKFRIATRCGMAFGAVHLGLAAEHIGNTRQTEEVINMLAKYFWTRGMASLHDWGNLFNMDISGGFPYLCASSLVYAEPGVIRFFPARPEQWKSGSLKGVRLRGGIVVRELTWSGAKAKAVLVSDSDQVVSISDRAGSAARSLALKAHVQTPVALDLEKPR